MPGKGAPPGNIGARTWAAFGAASPAAEAPAQSTVTETGNSDMVHVERASRFPLVQAAARLRVTRSAVSHTLVRLRELGARIERVEDTTPTAG